MLTDIKPIIPVLVSGLVSIVLIAVMLRVKHALPLDHPNHRSMHVQPIPRSGGVGIMLGLACGWLVAWPSGLMLLLGLALALSGLSLLDDVRGLSVKIRLSLQIAAAVFFIASRPSLPGGVFGAALAVLALAWMTNLYNFMDGSNGLAGGMALFGFGFYALAAGQGGSLGLCLAASCVAAAALGFLWFNFDPARIFMGDGGSIPLGFLAAALGLSGWQDGVWPLAFPLLVFSPFIIDASVTLFKRMLRGEKVWQAHREHYYQRMVRMGLGHRGTAFVEYGLMASSGISALLLLHAKPGWQTVILVAWAILYVAALITIDWLWNKHDQASQQ